MTDADLAQGSLFPPSSFMRKISHDIAVNVIRNAQKTGRCARTDIPADLDQYVTDYMYSPEYR